MPASTMLPNITSMCNPSMSSNGMPHWPNEDLSKHYCQVCFPTCKGVLNTHISKLDTYLYPSRHSHLPGYYYLLCSIPQLIAITLVKSSQPRDPSLAVHDTNLALFQLCLWHLAHKQQTCMCICLLLPWCCCCITSCALLFCFISSFCLG
jgi:hypothetical protein